MYKHALVFPAIVMRKVVCHIYTKFRAVFTLKLGIFSLIDCTPFIILRVEDTLRFKTLLSIYTV